MTKEHQSIGGSYAYISGDKREIGLMCNKEFTSLTLNEGCIEPMLDMFPSQDTKIFMAIAMCLMSQSEIDIDIEELSSLVRLDDHVVKNAIDFYLKNQIFLKTSEIQDAVRKDDDPLEQEG